MADFTKNHDDDSRARFLVRALQDECVASVSSEKDDGALYFRAETCFGHKVVSALHASPESAALEAVAKIANLKIPRNPELVRRAKALLREFNIVTYILLCLFGMGCESPSEQAAREAKERAREEAKILRCAPPTTIDEIVNTVADGYHGGRFIITFKNGQVWKLDTGYSTDCWTRVR